MTWAEALAIFNFIVWLLPIIVRTWMAIFYDSTSESVLSTSEHQSISKAIGKLNLRGKRLKIGSDSERTGNSEEGSK